MYSWGDNTYGNLGLGDTSNRSTPVPLPTFGENKEKVKQLYCGTHHTIAITGISLFHLPLERNTIYGWGYNSDYSQLGLGHSNDVLSPTEIPINVPNHFLPSLCALGYFHSFILFDRCENKQQKTQVNGLKIVGMILLLFTLSREQTLSFPSIG